jgi:hypothetical protein
MVKEFVGSSSHKVNHFFGATTHLSAAAFDAWL